MKTLCFLLAAFLILTTFGHAEPDTAEVDRLVALLEDDSFRVRKKAQIDLAKTMDFAGPELWQHLAKVDTSELPETKLRLAKIMNILKGDHALTLVDATQQPIPNAVVKVFRPPAKQHAYEQKGAKFLGRTFTDAHGRFNVPGPDEEGPRLPDLGDIPRVRELFATGHTFQLEVFASGYGAAGIRWPTMPPKGDRNQVRVPLVHDDSEEAERSVIGTVRDEAGKPVRRAVVHALSLELDFGGYNLEQAGRGLTDASGAFRLYKSAARINQGKLLPKGAKTRIQVGGSEWFTSGGTITNGTPTELLVRKGSLKRQFTFEGGIDKRQSHYVKYVSEKDRFAIVLDQQALTDGVMLIPGTYSGHMGNVQFENLVVDESSPAILEFKRKADLMLRGKVLDGVANTGAEAVIIGFSGSNGEGELVDLTDEELKEMIEVPMDKLKATPGFKKIEKAKRVVCFGRSDENGTYEIDSEGKKMHGMIAFAPGMLPVTTRALHREDKEKDGKSIQLYPLRLFPAAKVRLEAMLPKGIEVSKQVKLWPDVVVTREQEMPWFGRFEKTSKAQYGTPGFHETKYSASVGEPRFFYVPANVEFRMLFEPSYNKSWGPLIFDEAMTLKPGEVRDLGKVVLRKTVPVKVRVSGPDGKPVEGVAIRMSYVRTNGASWLIGKFSDKEGMVELLVAPGMKGRFGARQIRGPKEIVRADNLTIPFEIDGSTDKVFEIKLTKEQMDLLP